MAAPNENTPSWRSGMKRMIPPWEYRYLRVFAGIRIAGVIFVAGLGALTLWRGFYGWTALLLAVAAPLISFGYLELSVARSAPPRT